MVGGRCAGSPLATFLARSGARVCVIDRSRFPSDIPSTHGIQPCGVKVLDRLGVLSQLLKLTPAIDSAVAAFGSTRVERDGATDILGAPMINVRRITLDAVLLDAAAASGADVRTGEAVTGLVVENGRVAGVRTDREEVRAPLVIGADGPRSTVARMVRAGEYLRTPPGRTFVWAYFSGVPADGCVRLGKPDDHAFLASPTDGGLYLAAVGVSPNRRATWPSLEQGYFSAITEWPELADLLVGAERVGPVRVMSRWHGYFRPAAGRGWALVGDAGHFKDPTPGQGISDALRQAEHLAGLIASGGNQDRTLAGWWKWRDRDAKEMFWFAHQLGAPGPTPPIQGEMIRRITADPDLTDDLFRLLNHDLPASKLFTPSLALAATATVFHSVRQPWQVTVRQFAALAANEAHHMFTPRRRARAGEPSWPADDAEPSSERDEQTVAPTGRGHRSWPTPT